MTKLSGSCLCGNITFSGDAEIEAVAGTGREDS